MPKQRRFAQGRACLLLAVPGRDVADALVEAGFTVQTAADEAEALDAIKQRRFAVVLVYRAVGAVAMQAVISRAGGEQPPVPVVVLASSASLQDAVESMRHGAVDYLPPDLPPQVVAARTRSATAGRAAAATPAEPSMVGLAGVVGHSAAMRNLQAAVERISRYKTNVLLLGESGSGKELVARALHARGPRRQRLFVPINCATLGREILENELFGHERGAFTGANERKNGLFELADGGTLFLDEIGELDPSTQAKLLRVLERNEFRRLGGSEKVKVDLGLIAATNRDLEESIANGHFRRDFYYRLKVVTIVVPPLRDRKEDIPALVEAFVADFNRRNSGRIRGITPRALKLLMEHNWPGNVRELKNAIESAAVLAIGDTIDADGFPELAPAAGPLTNGYPVPGLVAVPVAGDGDSIVVSGSVPLAEVEKAVILEQVRRSRTKTGAAHVLGIGLRTLYTKLRQYGAGPGA